MRKTISIDDTRFNQFMKTTGRSHNEKMAELLNVYTKKDTDAGMLYVQLESQIWDIEKMLDKKLEKIEVNNKLITEFLKEVKPLMTVIQDKTGGY